MFLLRDGQPSLATYSARTVCRTSNGRHGGKVSEQHHKYLYSLSRDLMTPGARWNSRIRCRIWAMYFLLRADLCTFRQGIYLCSFIPLLNKWLLNTCYYPLLYWKLQREHGHMVLPSSYLRSGREHSRPASSAEVETSRRCLRARGRSPQSCWGWGSIRRKWEWRFRLG